ncbi:MAG: hypothetical protein Q8T08_23820, partial [Ignavibacteria bacterium]|nr:hypothetical protein [Ignavibacteria bacterium]
MRKLLIVVFNSFLLVSFFFLFSGNSEPKVIENELNSENSSSNGTAHTFCIGDISIKFIDGGNATMTRYGSNGSVIKQVIGEWNSYGSKTDLPGQTIKAKFNGSEFSFTLIYDGLGKASVLIDGEGRRYTLCKTETIITEDNSSID